MKIRNRAAVMAMALFLCLTFMADFVSAEETYTYTVTFYTGNQGTMTGPEGLSVRYNRGTVQVQPDKITVSGLNMGDIISFDAQAGAINMDDAGKYYIKGIRKSGRDNSTVTASAFQVDGDADYVIAYGIKGDTVSYKVNYQDETGNTLAQSKTYYGNVGDKAVAAYLYIEGYTPQALAIAKTLSANEAENVITFLYARDETPDQTETTGGSTGTQTGTPESGAGTQTGTTGNSTGTQTGTAGGGTGAEDGGENADAADAEDGGAAAADADNAAGADDAVNLPDDEVPLDQELLDLDDEEVPKGNTQLENQKAAEKRMPLILCIGIGAAAAAVLITMVIVLAKRRKAAKASSSVHKSSMD